MHLHVCVRTCAYAHPRRRPSASAVRAKTRTSTIAPTHSPNPHLSMRASTVASARLPRLCTSACIEAHEHALVRAPEACVELACLSVRAPAYVATLGPLIAPARIRACAHARPSTPPRSSMRPRASTHLRCVSPRKRAHARVQVRACPKAHAHAPPTYSVCMYLERVRTCECIHAFGPAPAPICMRSRSHAYACTCATHALTSAHVHMQPCLRACCCAHTCTRVCMLWPRLAPGRTHAHPYALPSCQSTRAFTSTCLRLRFDAPKLRHADARLRP